MTLSVFLAVLVSTVMHALWNFAARRVRGNLVVIWAGLCIASLCCLPVVFLRGALARPVLAQSAPFMIATGVIHAFYFALLALCYRKGEISIVYPVARGTGVAGAALMAIALLGESLSLYGGLAVILICSGTIVLGLSDRSRSGSIGTSLKAVLVGASIAAYSVVDKLGIERADPVLYIFSLFFIAAVVLAPLVLLRNKGKVVKELKGSVRFAAIIGLGSMATYMIILFSFRLERMSYIVATREFAVVIGSILGITLLKEPLNIKKGVGIAAITAGLIFIKLA